MIVCVRVCRCVVVCVCVCVCVCVWCGVHRARWRMLILRVALDCVVFRYDLYDVQHPRTTGV